MRATTAFVLTVFTILEVGCGYQEASEGSVLAENHDPSVHVQSTGVNDQNSSGSRLQADIEWLVGRWRCVARQYFTKDQMQMAINGDSLLDYFNVYFPYADDQLTVELTEQPARQIAAEFVTRRVYDPDNFRERPWPMFEGGPVFIGKNRTVYGNIPRSSDFDFKYSTEERSGTLWLILESRSMRFELVKKSEVAGNIEGSFVQAPIRTYSPERIAELQRRYADLTKSLPHRKPTQKPH